MVWPLRRQKRERTARWLWDKAAHSLTRALTHLITREPGNSARLPVCDSMQARLPEKKNASPPLLSLTQSLSGGQGYRACLRHEAMLLRAHARLSDTEQAAPTRHGVFNQSTRGPSRPLHSGRKAAPGFCLPPRAGGPALSIKSMDKCRHRGADHILKSLVRLGVISTSCRSANNPAHLRF